MVPGCVTRSLVDVPQAIHVDAGKHEAPVGLTCAVDLECERMPAYLPAECPGESVEVRALKPRLQAGALGYRLGPFLGSSLAVRGRTGSIVGRLLPQPLDLLCFGSVGTRDGLLDQEGSPLPPPSPVVAFRGRPIGLGRGLVSARRPQAEICRS